MRAQNIGSHTSAKILRLKGYMKHHISKKFPLICSLDNVDWGDSVKGLFNPIKGIQAKSKPNLNSGDTFYIISRGQYLLGMQAECCEMCV